jgi:hypothetical protein
MHAGYGAVLLFGQQGDKTVVDRLNANSHAGVNVRPIAALRVCQ